LRHIFFFLFFLFTNLLGQKVKAKQEFEPEEEVVVKVMNPGQKSKEQKPVRRDLGGEQLDGVLFIFFLAGHNLGKDVGLLEGIHRQLLGSKVESLSLLPHLTGIVVIVANLERRRRRNGGYTTPEPREHRQRVTHSFEEESRARNKGNMLLFRGKAVEQSVRVCPGPHDGHRQANHFPNLVEHETLALDLQAHPFESVEHLWLLRLQERVGGLKWGKRKRKRKKEKSRGNQP